MSNAIEWATAHARESPSKVEVPRPISSNRMRHLLVKLFNMLAVSFISTKNVDSHPAKLSEAPTLVNNWSALPKSHFFAGTKEPIWANNTFNPVCLRKVHPPQTLQQGRYDPLRACAGCTCEACQKQTLRVWGYATSLSICLKHSGLDRSCAKLK